MPSLIAYKATNGDGESFRACEFGENSGKRVKYEVGSTVEVKEARGGDSCGHGLHVSPTALATVQYSDKSQRPWRWFEVSIDDGDVLGRDATKLRVSRLMVTRELSISDVIGTDRLIALQSGIASCKAESSTWVSIPWLKPTAKVSDEIVESLFCTWRETIEPWIQKRRTGYELPTAVRIVRSAAADAADAAAAAAAADAADAAAVLLLLMLLLMLMLLLLLMLLMLLLMLLMLLLLLMLLMPLRQIWPYWTRWYVRPWYALHRYARWKLYMGDAPNPWEPIVDMFKLGCVPIGYARNPATGDVEFVVYVPEAK